MSTSSKYSAARKHISDQGIGHFMRAIWDRFFLPVIYAPLCYIAVQRMKKGAPNIDEVVRFVFDTLKIDGLAYLEPMQVRSELVALMECVKSKKPRVVMEIGSARGGTLLLLSQVASANALLLSLDMPGGKYGGYPWWRIPLYRSFASRGQRIKLFRGDSHEESMVQKIREFLGGRKIDFLFIDADHTYEGVKRDFEVYSPLVRRGGIIALHDVARTDPPTPKSEVDKYWNEIKNNFDHTEIIEGKAQGWAGVGLIHIK